MSKKTVIIVVIFIFGSIITTNILINIYLGKNLNTLKENFIRKPSSVKDPAAVTQKPRTRGKLLKSDPSKYGIVITPKEDEPKSQMHWDIFVDKIIASSDVLNQDKVVPVLEKSKITPEDYKSRMDKLDERILIHEERKQNDPSDFEAANKLQDLYMLKSMLKAMKAKIILKP